MSSRRGGTITTLGRGLHAATVWFRIEPMAARDAADLAALEYGCSWLAWPDESRRHDVGVIGEKEPTARNLAEFDSNLDRVFESLTWDLPLLHPDATYVIWQLTAAEHTDWIAQGWFCAYATHRVEVYEAGDVARRCTPTARPQGAISRMSSRTPCAIAASTIPDETCVSAHGCHRNPKGYKHFDWASNGMRVKTAMRSVVGQLRYRPARCSESRELAWGIRPTGSSSTG
ncbi:hypothetical protein ACWIGI_22045 [Nocardia sp. NPDC055321]